MAELQSTNIYGDLTVADKTITNTLYVVGEQAVFPNNQTTEGIYFAKSYSNDDIMISLVSGTADQCYIDLTDTAADYRGRILYDNSSDYLGFFAAASERLRINSNGTIYMCAVSAPYSTFGQDANGIYWEHDGTSTANEDIRIQTSKSGDGTNYIQFFLDPTDGFSFSALGTGYAKATFAATTTNFASTNLPHGTAPSSPVNGDMWTTTAGLYVRINGSTVGPLDTGSGDGTVTSVAAGNGMNFTTITTTGSVTMGTPSTLDNSTTNGVTSTSHTHQITNGLISGSDGVSVTASRYAIGGTLSISLGAITPTSISTGAGTFTGLVQTPASASGSAGLRAPHGSAPTSPTNGDIWTTTSGIYVRINGSTVGPLSSSSGTVTSVSAGNGMNFTTITSSGSVTMGTPSQVSRTSTNSVTSTSHTHDLGALSAGDIDTGNLGITYMPTGGSWSLSSDLNIDSNKLHIDQANGRIGIGVDPECDVHIKDGDAGCTFFAYDNFVIEDSGDVTMRLCGGTTNDIWLYFGDGDARDRAAIRYDHNNDTMYFKINGNLAGLWDSDELRLYSSFSFNPSTTGSQDLGNATYYWGNVDYKYLNDRGCIVKVDKVEARNTIKGIKRKEVNTEKDAKKFHSKKYRKDGNKFVEVSDGRSNKDMVDYSAFPDWIYDDGTHIAKKDKIDDEGNLIHKKGDVIQGREGIEIGGVISLLLAHNQDLEDRIEQLEAQLAIS